MNTSLYEKLSSCKKQLPARCRKEFIVKFNILIDNLAELVSYEPEMFKGLKVEPAASAMFTVVAFYLGMGRKEVHECLRLGVNSNYIPNDVNRILRFSSYKKLAQLLKKLII